jgi:hypothetical protein
MMVTVGLLLHLKAVLLLEMSLSLSSLVAACLCFTASCHTKQWYVFPYALIRIYMYITLVVHFVSYTV